MLQTTFISCLEVGECVAPLLATLKYCTILVNLAGHVMCYMPAEILISAHGGNDCYIDFFGGQVRGNSHHISHHDSDHNLKLTSIIWSSGGITMSGWRNEKLRENQLVPGLFHIS